MKTFWISWWDPIDGKNGLDTNGIVVWRSGTRSVQHRGEDREQASCCALVVAETADEAWGKADRYYPGAATAERRFEQEHEKGWRPENRFPLNDAQERRIAAAEAVLS